jgi:hypothetical protein
METFSQYIRRVDEGFFGGTPHPQSMAIPSLLAYHITDMINQYMINSGKMIAPDRHTPAGSNDPRYDPSSKLKLRNHFFDIARKFMGNNDLRGIADYFGFDLSKGKSIGQGRFVSDIGNMA